MHIVSKLRTAVALVIAVAGVGVIGLIPYTRWTSARDRRDLDRALTPLVRVPIEDLQPGREQTLTVILPTDRQWQSIVDRLGKPALVIVVATDRAAIHPQAYSATDARLEAHGTQNGRPLEVSLTKELPFGYSSTTSQTAYKFSTSGNDVVQLAVRMIPAAVPKDALLMIFPLWNHLELWHWGDSMSMGQGLFELVAPVLIVIGVALVFVGAMVGLIPLQPTR